MVAFDILFSSKLVWHARRPRAGWHNLIFVLRRSFDLDACRSRLSSRHGRVQPLRPRSLCHRTTCRGAAAGGGVEAEGAVGADSARRAMAPDERCQAGEAAGGIAAFPGFFAGKQCREVTARQLWNSKNADFPQICHCKSLKSSKAGFRIYDFSRCPLVKIQMLYNRNPNQFLSVSIDKLVHFHQDQNNSYCHL